MRHHPTRGSSPDPGCWDRFVSSESAAGPGVPWRLGIGRPGPAGRLSPQQGGKFSVTLPNSSEGQLRETPRAGGLGEREDVDHQLSPPGEGQCAGRGSRPRCIFFFFTGWELSSSVGDPCQWDLSLPQYLPRGKEAMATSAAELGAQLEGQGWSRWLHQNIKMEQELQS